MRRCCSLRTHRMRRYADRCARKCLIVVPGVRPSWRAPTLPQGRDPPLAFRSNQHRAAPRHVGSNKSERVVRKGSLGWSRCDRRNTTSILQFPCVVQQRLRWGSLGCWSLGNARPHNVPRRDTDDNDRRRAIRATTATGHRSLNALWNAPHDDEAAAKPRAKEPAGATWTRPTRTIPARERSRNHTRSAPQLQKNRAEKRVHFCTTEIPVVHHQFPCRNKELRHSWCKFFILQ